MSSNDRLNSALVIIFFLLFSNLVAVSKLTPGTGDLNPPVNLKDNVSRFYEFNLIKLLIKIIMNNRIRHIKYL